MPDLRLTETSPVCIYQKPGDGLKKPRSTGKCGLHCEFRIVDDDGNEVPEGVSGEILIRGGNVLREYWNNPEETRRALKDGCSIPATSAGATKTATCSSTTARRTS